LPLFGVSLPRALFWPVLVSVFVAPVLSFLLGRPLLWLRFRPAPLPAAFRSALVRLRAAAAAVGFSRGARVAGP
ncbi:multidrug ABC transporter ATP-binding protein, partial [Mycobacterium tuberculosis]